MIKRRGKLEEIILLKNQELGDAYEVVKVKRGHAWNYLIPSELAMISNDSNLNWLKRREKKILEEREKSKIISKEIFDKINEQKINFVLRKNQKGEVYGSIVQKDIIEKIKEMSPEVNLEKYHFSNFKPLNEIGEHRVKIKLDKDVEVAKLTVLVS